MDEYAQRSQEGAAAARDSGSEREIAAVEVTGREHTVD